MTGLSQRQEEDILMSSTTHFLFEVPFKKEKRNSLLLRFWSLVGVSRL